MKRFFRTPSSTFHCLLFLFILSIIGSPLKAQIDSLSQDSVSTSIARLYDEYFKLEKVANQIESRLNTSVNNLEDRYKALENQAQGNSEQLKTITDEDRRSNQIRYERSRLSIIGTANFMNSVNNSLNALEFSVSSLDYSNSIFELNNPTNTDLGFSLDKVILKVVEEKIIKGKFGKKFGSKLKSIISGILNNPIINNPITKAIVSTVPAVSSITSVFNVVNSAAVSNDDISTTALNEFAKELQKYVAHYEALAKASRDLDFNLSNLKLKSEAVRKLATNFVQENISDIYTQQDQPDIKNLDMNDMVKRYYNYVSVSEYIARVESTKPKNYDFLSKRFVFPMVGRSKASFINEEVEKLYNEYLTTLSTYHSNIIVILNNATKLSDDETKVAKKIVDLDNRYKLLISAYQKNVDIDNLKALEDNIPRF